MFVFLASILVILTVAGLLVPPLRRQRQFLPRKAGAMTIFGDQLGEIDLDLQRGLISGQEAEAARNEIKRRMLSLDKLTSDSDDAELSADKAKGSWLPIAGALIAPAAAVALYLLIGSPDTPSLPIASRTAETEKTAQVAELAIKLRNRLETDPNSPTEAWLLLGRTYMRMGRYSDAAYAFGQIADRNDVVSTTLSRYAEALVAVDNGIVTPKAEAAAEKALILDPSNVAGTFYKALALEQSGERLRAYRMLQERFDMATGFEPWMPTLASRANAIASQIGETPITIPTAEASEPGPTAADVEAASDMSVDERQEFIQSMVERLAARLKGEPGNLDGWLRLARAYSVLGKVAEAQKAYKKAEKLVEKLPADDSRRDIIRRALSASDN